MHLGRGVDVAGVQGRVLVHQGRCEDRVAPRAPGVEDTRLQVLDPPGPGSDPRVLGTVVGALAVDHHRAGEHDPTDAGAVRGAQDAGGAEVVRRDVVDDVVEVDPEPDLGGEVHDHVRPGERGREDLLVPDVAHHQSRTRQRRRSPAGVHVGAQRVEDGHVVTVRDQAGDRGPTDEAGSAGDEDAHAPSIPSFVRRRPDGSLTGRRDRAHRLPAGRYGRAHEQQRVAGRRHRRIRSLPAPRRRRAGARQHPVRGAERPTAGRPPGRPVGGVPAPPRCGPPVPPAPHQLPGQPLGAAQPRGAQGPGAVRRRCPAPGPARRAPWWSRTR